MIRIYGDILLVDRPDPDNICRLDNAPLKILSAMEVTGMRVDPEFLTTLHDIITEEMEELEQKAERLVGKHININSGDQLSDLLFKELRLRQPGKEKRTKVTKRLSADADVLKGMISQHPVISVYLDWKEREKLRSAYTFTLVRQMDSNNRVHPDIIHTGPETGRYAVKDPALQTIPQRTKLGRMIRHAFIADPGEVIGSADLGQIEMRHAGEDAKCPNLINVFVNNEDLYFSVAEGINQRTYTPEERAGGIDPATGISYHDGHRQDAKVIALATIYDISPEGLVDQLLAYKAIRFLTGGASDVWDYDRYYKSAVELCRTAIRNFFVKYPELLARRRFHHKRVIRTGMAWDMFGRHRWIPQVFSTHQYIVSEGLRAAGNMPIQGSCAGIMKLWLKVLSDLLDQYWGRFVKPLMTVHDEVLVSGQQAPVEDFLQEAAGVVRILLPSELYSTPLKASWGTAESWGLVQK